MQLILALSSSRLLALEGTIGVPENSVDDPVGNECSTLKLSVNDELLFVDVKVVLTQLAGAVGLLELEDKCIWDHIILGLLFESLKSRVSFTLLVLDGLSGFLAIFEDQLAVKSAGYSATKNCRKMALKV